MNFVGNPNSQITKLIGTEHPVLKRQATVSIPNNAGRNQISDRPSWPRDTNAPTLSKCPIRVKFGNRKEILQPVSECLHFGQLVIAQLRFLKRWVTEYAICDHYYAADRVKRIDTRVANFSLFKRTDTPYKFRITYIVPNLRPRKTRKIKDAFQKNVRIIKDKPQGSRKRKIQLCSFAPRIQRLRMALPSGYRDSNQDCNRCAEGLSPAGQFFVRCHPYERSCKKSVHIKIKQLHITLLKFSGAS